MSRREFFRSAAKNLLGAGSQMISVAQDVYDVMTREAISYRLSLIFREQEMNDVFIQQAKDVLVDRMPPIADVLKPDALAAYEALIGEKQEGIESGYASVQDMLDGFQALFKRLPIVQDVLDSGDEHLKGALECLVENLDEHAGGSPVGDLIRADRTDALKHYRTMLGQYRAIADYIPAMRQSALRLYKGDIEEADRQIIHFLRMQGGEKKLSTVLEKMRDGGVPNFIRYMEKNIQRDMDWDAGMRQDKAQELRKLEKFGELTPDGQKIFMALSSDREVAKKRAQLIGELTFTKVPQVTRRKNELQAVELDDPARWPEDRCVPVPTRHFVPVYGIYMPVGDAHSLQAFLNQHPITAKILRPHMSEFGCEKPAQMRGK